MIATYFQEASVEASLPSSLPRQGDVAQRYGYRCHKPKVRESNLALAISFHTCERCFISISSFPPGVKRVPDFKDSEIIAVSLRIRAD